MTPSSSRASSHIVVFLYIGMLWMVTLNTWLRVVPETKLDGVSFASTEPKFSLTSIWRGEFQDKADKWYAARVGFRSYFVKLDCSLTYWLFGETPRQSRVTVGQSGTLFVDEDVAFFNAVQLPSKGELVDDVRTLSSLQDKLARKNKLLLLVTLPSKTSLMAEHFPSWIERSSRGETGNSLYRFFALELANAGVNHVDGRALLQHEAERRNIAMFEPYARHYNTLGACLVTKAVHEKITKLRKEPGVSIECEDVSRATVTTAHADFDLYKLMNIWDPRSVKFDALQYGYKILPPRAGAPSALLVGTSFSWSLMEHATRNGAFSETHMLYYNATHAVAGKGILGPIEPKSSAWREIVLSRDIIVIESPEGFWDNIGSGFAKQLNEIL
jgi:hypothetical protein